MDLHQVIASSVEEVLDGIRAANKELDGKARVGEPSVIEVEFGITSTYEVANYDDVNVAKIRVKLPLFSSEPKPTAMAATVADDKTAAKKKDKEK